MLNRTEYADRCTFDTRIYISSAPLDIERLVAGSRGYWGVESMHWLLDGEFKDDAGHGAKNMAVVRRFALGLLRANKSKGSIKTRRKSASWNTQVSASRSLTASRRLPAPFYCFRLKRPELEQIGKLLRLASCFKSGLTARSSWQPLG